MNFFSRQIQLLREGIPRPFWALLVGTFITKAGSFVVTLLFVYLTQFRGLSLTTAGAVASLFGLGSLSGSLLGGISADRLGRKRTMLGALCGGAVFMIVLGFSRELAAIAASAFFLGLTADAYRPASQALVADLIPDKHRMKAFGMQYWAINLGFSFAAIVGGTLAKYNFTLLFLCDAFTTLVLAAIILRAVPETRPKERERLTGHALTPFLDGRFVPFLLVNFAIGLLFFQHLSSLLNEMHSKGLGTQQFGWVMATNGVAIVLLQPLMTRWASKLKPQRVLALAALLTGVGFFLPIFATTAIQYAMTVAVWTLGEILSSPVGASTVAALSPRHLRGRYQAAFMITWASSAMLAPLVGSAVIVRFGHSALWLACGGVGVLTAGFALRLKITR